MMLSMSFWYRRGSGLLAAVLLPCSVLFMAADPALAEPSVDSHVVTPYAQQTLKAVQDKAQDGDGTAELELGLRYVKGSDGVKNVPLGVEWIKKAAERSIPQAEHEMGSLYLMGIGVPQSNVMAVEWFRRAAIQGFAPSQTALGFAYEEGAGVPKDAELARYWFEKAAAQKSGIAAESLSGGM